MAKKNIAPPPTDNAIGKVSCPPGASIGHSTCTYRLRLHADVKGVKPGVSSPVRSGPACSAREVRREAFWSVATYVDRNPQKTFFLWLGFVLFFPTLFPASHPSLSLPHLSSPGSAPPRADRQNQTRRPPKVNPEPTSTVSTCATLLAIPSPGNLTTRKMILL